MLKSSLILLMFVILISGCKEESFSNINYEDEEIQNKILEKYKKDFDKIEFENIVQNKKYFYIDYNFLLREKREKEIIVDNCNISYKMKNDIIFDYPIKMDKNEIISMGRKKYYNKLEKCIEKNIEILKKRQKEKEKKEKLIEERLSEKI